MFRVMSPLVPIVRCPKLSGTLLFYLLAVAITDYAQVQSAPPPPPPPPPPPVPGVTGDLQFQKPVPPSTSYYVKAYGDVFSPANTTWDISVQVERLVPGGNPITVINVRYSGTGGALAHWSTQFDLTRTPPPGGDEYKLTITGYYTDQNMQRTNFTMVTKTATLTP